MLEGVRHIKVGSLKIGNNIPLTLIAGPCALESRQHALDVSGKLVDISERLGIGLIYKTSFDKANRTSGLTPRGIGLDAAAPIFSEIRETFKIPVLTDVHNESQCQLLKGIVDVIQIPAFLCRQTDLLTAAASTGCVINVKKGQFLAPWDMNKVAEKISNTGNHNILLTERGTSFGYNSLVSDMRSLPILARTGYPVVFDATHSVQQPGGLGSTSGGEREFVPALARAAVAVGVAAVFMETHENPDHAPSDGPNMIQLNKLEAVLETLMSLDCIAKASN